MEELNPQQIKAVEHMTGPCMIIASPGSGKTTVITSRVIRLIEKGIDPTSILCMTFTNKAANEMKERICKKLNVQNTNFFIGTFHSFCASVLRNFGNRIGYGKFTILDQKEQEDVIYQVARSMGKDKKEDQIDARVIADVVNKLRENLETLEELQDHFDNPLFSELAIRYLEVIREQNVIDFSGLLSETYYLLKNNGDILEKFQERLKYILLDECQDTNLLQFQIVGLIGEKHRNIFITGDLSQSIYKFRGARYQNILDFLEEHPDCVKIPLNFNYRSTPQIIKVADKLIKHNKSHMSPPMQTNNPDGPEVVCKSFKDATEEAQFIASNIKYFIEQEGYDPTDIAVLYRLNRLSLELQMVFTNAKIPFVILGGFSFFDRKEIKDVLSMLRFVINPKDSIAFNRVISIFGGIGDTSIGKIENIAKEKNIDFMEACKNSFPLLKRVSAKSAVQKMLDVFSKDYSLMGPGECLVKIIEEIKYFDKLKSSGLDSPQERIDNVNEIIANTTEFEQSNKSVESYLQNISLITSSDQKNDDAVSLMTIHSAKGTQREIIYVIGVETHLLPHKLALDEAKNTVEIEEVEAEERRIFYVSITRPRKNLCVSYCKNRKIRSKKGKLIYIKSYPSQFLFEAGLLKEENCGKIYETY